MNKTQQLIEILAALRAIAQLKPNDACSRCMQSIRFQVWLNISQYLIVNIASIAALLAIYTALHSVFPMGIAIFLTVFALPPCIMISNAVKSIIDSNSKRAMSTHCANFKNALHPESANARGLVIAQQVSATTRYSEAPSRMVEDTAAQDDARRLEAYLQNIQEKDGEQVRKNIVDLLNKHPDKLNRLLRDLQEKERAYIELEKTRKNKIFRWQKCANGQVVL